MTIPWRPFSSARNVECLPILLSKMMAIPGLTGLAQETQEDPWPDTA